LRRFIVFIPPERRAGRWRNLNRLAGDFNWQARRIPSRLTVVRAWPEQA
jgi:hypothetical protein